MGLSVRERQALHSIEAGLAASYPRLASRLAVFTRMTAGEAFPADENIRAHRFRGCVHWPLAWPLLWLVISVALISAGLAVSHGGGGTCAMRASSCARYKHTDDAALFVHRQPDATVEAPFPPPGPLG